MTNTNHGLVKTAPARELAFFGAHINLHYLFVLYAGVSIYYNMKFPKLLFSSNVHGYYTRKTYRVIKNLSHRQCRVIIGGTTF